MVNAFITLLFSDSYLPGALVVGHALRDLGTEAELAVLVTDSVSDSARSALSAVFRHVIPVPLTLNDSSNSALNLTILNRPELAATYTKIHVWNQRQFDRVVFLDADTLPLQSLDSLFSLPLLNSDSNSESTVLYASPDAGWPDVFNSGVFVTQPSAKTFVALRNSLITASQENTDISFDGADQGFLNEFFPNWHRLPFAYNVTPSAAYQYLPALRRFRSEIRIVHFIGPNKPWRSGGGAGGAVEGYTEFLDKWWHVFGRHYPLNAPLGQSTGSAMTRALRELSLYDSNKVISVPQNSWDGTKRPPPVISEAEAANFNPKTATSAWSLTGESSESAKPAESEESASGRPADLPPPLFPWEFDNYAPAERIFY